MTRRKEQYAGLLLAVMVMPFIVPTILAIIGYGIANVVGGVLIFTDPATRGRWDRAMGPVCVSAGVLLLLCTWVVAL